MKNRVHMSRATRQIERSNAPRARKGSVAWARKERAAWALEDRADWTLDVRVLWRQRHETSDVWGSCGSSKIGTAFHQKRSRLALDCFTLVTFLFASPPGSHAQPR